MRGGRRLLWGTGEAFFFSGALDFGLSWVIHRCKKEVEDEV